MTEASMWRRCSACKEPIACGARYYACSVSTCNRKRTALMFCSVTCWEVHLPGANHREAWAEERAAPAQPEVAESATPAAKPKPAAAVSSRRLVRPPGSTPARSEAPHEVLIVASRLKDWVRAVSGMNTSDRVLDPLSDVVRRVCEQAIENARREGRKTVLDRDVPS